VITIVCPFETLLLIASIKDCLVGRAKINWIQQGKNCTEKKLGGPGVQKVREFNLALLEKWCWS